MALFSAHYIFWLKLILAFYAHLTEKNAFVWTGIYVFSRFFTLMSQENTLRNFASKCKKAKHTKSGAFQILTWRTPLKEHRLL